MISELSVWAGGKIVAYRVSEDSVRALRYEDGVYFVDLRVPEYASGYWIDVTLQYWGSQIVSVGTRPSRHDDTQSADATSADVAGRESQAR